MASHSRHLHAAGRTWRGDSAGYRTPSTWSSGKLSSGCVQLPPAPAMPRAKQPRSPLPPALCLRRSSLQDQLDRQPGCHTDSELVLWQTPRSLGPQAMFYHPPVGGSGKPGPQPPSGSPSIEAPGSACQTAGAPQTWGWWPCSLLHVGVTYSGQGADGKATNLQARRLRGSNSSDARRGPHARSPSPAAKTLVTGE